MARNGDTHVAQHLAPQDQSVGALMAQISEQTSRLVRDELRLARAEMTEKGRQAGRGMGLFGGAGLIGLYGIACFVAAAILAFGGPLPSWAAALIVGGVLLAAAGVAALLGKHEVTHATPPVPTEALGGIKHDVDALKGRSRS